MSKTLPFLSVLLTLSSLMGCAQKNEAPKVVTDAFAKKFNAASSIKWDKENETEWEAEFKINGTEYSANFESNGTWKETEHEIEMSEIPQIVKDTLIKANPDYRVKESEISETADGMNYEFTIKKGSSTMEIAIDEAGNIVKKKKTSDNEHEDEDDN